MRNWKPILLAIVISLAFFTIALNCILNYNKADEQKVIDMKARVGDGHLYSIKLGWYSTRIVKFIKMSLDDKMVLTYYTEGEKEFWEPVESTEVTSKLE